MPKMKTNRAAAKRFRVTGSGKFKHGKAGRRHILSSKGRTRKRRLGELAYAEGGDAKRLRRMIPYA